MTERDVPDDLMKVAREALVEAVAMSRNKSADAGFAVIARALAAERDRCALIGYATCAETRHVTLGDKVSAAILARP